MAGIYNTVDSGYHPMILTVVCSFFKVLRSTPSFAIALSIYLKWFFFLYTKAFLHAVGMILGSC